MITRRTKIEIVHDILKAIQDKGGRIKPTHLLYKSNLSHNKMKEYIEELKKKGMIEEKINDDNKLYLITDNGIRYINEFRKIREFSETFGL